MIRSTPVLVSLALHAGVVGAVAGWALFGASPETRPVPALAFAAEAPAVPLESEPRSELPPVESEPAPTADLVPADLPVEPPDELAPEVERVDFTEALRRAWKSELPPREAEPEPVVDEEPMRAVAPDVAPLANEQPAVAHPRVVIVAPRLRPGQVVTAADYPRQARRRGIEGVVCVRVQVSASGRVDQVTLARGSGHEILDQAALETVRGWSFHPALDAGEAVPGATEIQVRFQLQRAGA